jgi:hypothetical protein
LSTLTVSGVDGDRVNTAPGASATSKAQTKPGGSGPSTQLL